MADSWHFFAALQVWRESTTRRSILAETPWASDRSGLGLQKRFVLARVKRHNEASERSRRVTEVAEAA